MTVKTFCDGCGTDITGRGQVAVAGEGRRTEGYRLPRAGQAFHWCPACADLAFAAVRSGASQVTS